MFLSCAHVCLTWLTAPSHWDGQELLCHISHGLCSKQCFFVDGGRTFVLSWEDKTYLLSSSDSLPFSFKIIDSWCLLLAQKKMMPFILSGGGIMCDHHEITKWAFQMEVFWIKALGINILGIESAGIIAGKRRRRGGGPSIWRWWHLCP